MARTDGSHGSRDSHGSLAHTLAIPKLSDNGLVWLLQFLFKFLKVLGISVSNEFLAELIVIMPSSMYLLRQFINLDRDYFTKICCLSKMHKAVCI